VARGDLLTRPGCTETPMFDDALAAARLVHPAMAAPARGRPSPRPAGRAMPITLPTIPPAVDDSPEAEMVRHAGHDGHQHDCPLCGPVEECDRPTCAASFGWPAGA
jgi:hypothetical protein